MYARNKNSVVLKNQANKLINKKLLTNKSHQEPHCVR